MTSKKILKTLCACAATTAFTLPALADNSCPIEVGDTVKFEAVDATFKRMHALLPPIDEFDTAEDYKDRSEDRLDALDTPYVLIEGDYNPTAVTYDKDGKRLALSEYTWRREVNPKSIRPDTKRHTDIFNKLGIELNASLLYELKLAHFVVPGSSIPESKNRSVLTSTTTTTVFSVVDQAASSTKRRWATEWDEQQEVSFAFIKATPEEGRILKETMRVGIVGIPKPPYTYTDQYASGDIFFSRHSTDRHDSVFFAEVKCAVVTDAKGKVLKTINTLYESGL